MFYIVYLIGGAFLLLLGVTVSVTLQPAFAISINFINIFNFINPWALLFILAFCLMVLACTKSLRGLKDAFVFMFRKKVYSAEQCEGCLLAVKVTVLTAFAAGGIGSLMSVINLMRSMDLYSAEYWASSAGASVSTALISLIYAFVIALILLPLYTRLRGELDRKNGPEQSKHIVLRPKNKKAG